jgi:hypothetical protein
MFNVHVNKLNIQFTFHHMKDIGEAVGLQAITHCMLKINGTEFAGVAGCSAKDRFAKEIGRKISLKRALQSARVIFDMSPLERQAVWERYFQRNVPNGTWNWQWNDQMLADGVLDAEYEKVKA